MKKFITTLQINGQDRDIYEKNKMKHYGLCMLDKQDILIKTKGLKRKNYGDSIVHELLHAIRDEYKIDHKHMKEEEIVCRLSKAIIAVLEQIIPGINLLETLKK